MRIIKSISHLLQDELAWGTGRLFWPVWFACGIVAYFALPFEPSLLMAGGGVAGALLLVMLARAHAGYAIVIAILCAALGFAVAGLRTHLLADVPRISEPIREAVVEGYISQVDWYAESTRVQLSVHRLSEKGKTLPYQRLVLNAYDDLHAREKLRAGMWLVARVSLRPSPAPIFPEHPDPRFRDYFEQVAGRGTIRFVQSLAPPNDGQRDAIRGQGWWVQVQDWRIQLREAILQALPNENGAIAAALTMGDRSGISPETTEKLTAAGLLHFLSISGAHMAMVAGVVFLIFRRLLACVPGLAVRVNLKKLAAGMTFLVASFYLLISGHDFAAERSYIMIAVMLLAVMVDRPAFTMNALCLAAAVILLINPEAIYYPGLQMSFAATAALLGMVMFWQQWHNAHPTDHYSFWRHFGLRAVQFASLSAAAGMATEPFAAFYFHQFMPYAIIGNIVAVPLIEVLIMPFLMLSLLMLPFGAEAYPFMVVDIAMDWLIGLSGWIAQLPNAILTVPLLPQSVIICATLAIILLAFLRTRLRLLGVVPLGIGLAIFITSRPPDVMATHKLASVAVRGQDGVYAVVQGGDQDFAIKAWQRGLGKAVIDPERSLPGMYCKGTRCTYSGFLGRELLIARDKISAADCRSNAIILASTMIDENCNARLELGWPYTNAGPILLWFNQDELEMKSLHRQNKRMWRQALY